MSTSKIFCLQFVSHICRLSKMWKMLFKLEIVSRIMELDFRLDRNKCYFDVISQINVRNTKPCYSFHLFSVGSSPPLSPTEWSLSVFLFFLCIYPTQACLNQSRTSVTTALFVLKLFRFPKCILWRSFLFKTLDKQLHQVVKGRRYMPNTCCSAPELILLNFLKCIFFFNINIFLI